MTKRSLTARDYAIALGASEEIVRAAFKKISKRSVMPTERQSQRTVVQYIRTKYPEVLVFAIPNGGSRNKIEAANLKKDGVLAGVPDLFIARSYRGKQIPHPDNYLLDRIENSYYGLFIEMKSPKGKLTDSQADIINQLSAAGYRCEVCYSADEAMKVIDGYLS